MTDKQRNYIRVKAIQEHNEDKIVAMTGAHINASGIYVFERRDENGFKFAYIGKAQSQGVISRMAQHLSGYKQYIDKSIRKHGLYDDETNQYGWKPEVLLYCATDECDEYERQYIKQYAENGWQLRNVESGGTTGKTDINERKPSRGYRDGVKQGERNVIKKIAHLFDLHLKAVYKADKPSKNAEKAMTKFNEMIQGETDE